MRTDRNKLLQKSGMCFLHRKMLNLKLLVFEHGVYFNERVKRTGFFKIFKDQDFFYNLWPFIIYC